MEICLPASSWNGSGGEGGGRGALRPQVCINRWPRAELLTYSVPRYLPLSSQGSRGIFQGSVLFADKSVRVAMPVGGGEGWGSHTPPVTLPFRDWANA